MTLYLMVGLHDRRDLLRRLGQHSTGKGCLYLKSLEGVDMKTLEELIRYSMRRLKKVFV